MGFQTEVNLTPAPAVAGDFASSNPRASVLAGEGGLVAGPGGVTVGKFAWIEADGKTVVNHGTYPAQPDGFVHRDQQALITEYLGEASNVIPEGFPVTLFDGGDFFAENKGANASAKGGTVYADYSNGDVRTTLSSGFSATGSMGATFTASVNGGDDTQLDVTAVTGLISIGETISGTGITAGTKITGQVSGTPGGAGTYQLDHSNTAAAATVTSFGNVLDVTAVASGTLAIGDAVTGTGIPANSVVASQVSGTAGGVGIYTLSNDATAYAASTALTGVDSVADTMFTFKSVAAVGELAKISTWGN